MDNILQGIDPPDMAGSVNRAAGERQIDMQMRHPGSNQVVDGQKLDDVYSDRTYAVAGDLSGAIERWTIDVKVERSSAALSRVFGLLAMLDIVPTASRQALLDQQSMSIVLTFSVIGRPVADRLLRKLRQLPDTILIETRH